MKNVPMTLELANAAVARYNLSGGTARAVRLYLSGICATRAEAGRVAGVDAAVLTRAIKRMTIVRRCDCCGNEIKLVNV